MTDVQIAAKPKLLWVGAEPPPRVLAAVGAAWEIVPCLPADAVPEALANVPVAMARVTRQSEQRPHLERFLRAADEAAVVVVLLVAPSAQDAWDALARREGPVLCVSDDAPPAELAAKVAAAAALQPAFRNARRELAARGEWASTVISAGELAEQMRLAARLQRDFLPRRLPELDRIRFGVLYRPATWVSGDIYDVARLDERRVGFYVADAVGHGMPAALLTIFIKKALPTKHIVGHSYEIVSPEVSLAELNTAICEQNLSSCQFCTAVYCVLDAQDRTLTYARGGHPEPVLIRADGSVELLDAPGSLLGIFAQERFERRTVQLAPGDRVVLYSDGAEAALGVRPAEREASLTAALARWGQMDREEMLLRLADRVDHQRPHGRGEDDVTVVVLDVEA